MCSIKTMLLCLCQRQTFDSCRTICWLVFIMMLSLQEMWLDLLDMQAEANRFHYMAECLVNSSRPRIGKQQLEQIVAADNEIQSMQQVCAGRITLLGGSTSDIVVSNDD
jgi:hypothetical protein